MPRVDQASIKPMSGSRYPSPFDIPCQARTWLPVALAGGLTQFGVNLLTLKPGVWSSQRHWHSHEDEFVYVVRGRPTLVDDSGAAVLEPGDCAAFPAGVENGHHLKNETEEDVLLLVVGSRNDADYGEYPDIDMKFLPGRYSGSGGYCRKDGSRF